jgi:PKD repeat protein
MKLKIKNRKAINFTLKTVFVLYVAFVIQSCYNESYIPITPNFTTEFINADESVPVIIKINNLTTGAENYQWQFQGGSPETSADKNPPQILYNAPGTYTIKLIATNNDGEEEMFTKTIEIKDAIDIQYTTTIIGSNYPSVEVVINNTTTGVGLTYNWSFQGGIPATFVGQTPPNVVFSSAGDHIISLTVSNGFESVTEQVTINVLPQLVSDFNWEPIFIDQDYQAPVTINLNNLSDSATNYSWAFQGGVPLTSIVENPTVTFNNPGTYQITLVASNDKASQTKIKTITILPNTNLYIFNDVQLGINSAHNGNTKGAFFATTTGQTYTVNQVNSTNSSLIEIAFLGLNSSFTYNKFISPAAVQSFGFVPLTSPQNTVFINSQEFCGCGPIFTVANFNSMINDLPLQGLSINTSGGSNQEFDNTNLPRIILFRTGLRKGAIKIKQMVNDGVNSYIICDIKIQK